MLPTVLITEAATAAGILGLLPLSLGAALSLLPIIGVALNGTSSVLYGTVPDLAPPERRSHAFGVFYTGTIGAGALSPALYGLFGDAAGILAAMMLGAIVVLLIIAFALLHGAGNGIITIAKGTLPLALFGPQGYGLRGELLSAPARVFQSAAPFLFGLLLTRIGVEAVWLSVGLCLAALGSLFALHPRRAPAARRLPARSGAP
jgi:hypothetical protein